MCYLLVFGSESCLLFVPIPTYLSVLLFINYYSLMILMIYTITLYKCDFGVNIHIAPSASNT